MRDYTKFGYDEKPFCDDGMTVDEISRFYRGGRTKTKPWRSLLTATIPPALR